MQRMLTVVYVVWGLPDRSIFQGKAARKKNSC